MAANLVRASQAKLLSPCQLVCASVARVHTRTSAARDEPKGESQQPATNRSWRVLKYRDDVSQAVRRVQSDKLPRITRPNDLLVKVIASSINPIDIAMIHGYGNLLLSVSNYFMTSGIESLTGDRLPLTLGRDFVGHVVGRGQTASQAKVGDLVWGTVAPFEDGTHADHVVACENMVSLKPSNVSHTDAASLPYAGMTAWSAINTFGELDDLNTKGKRALVFGAGGAVGSFCVQLLKHWGAHVVATCSPRSMNSLRELADVDELIDYNTIDDYLQDHSGTFDFILDCSSTHSARKNYEALTRIHEGQQTRRSTRVFDRNLTRYVTLSSPLLNNFDRYGLFAGMTSTLSDAIADTLSGLRYGLAFRWAYFLPNPKAMEAITELVASGVIKPYNVEVVDFEHALDAYTRLDSNETHSKIVFDHSKSV